MFRSWTSHSSEQLVATSFPPVVLRIAGSPRARLCARPDHPVGPAGASPSASPGRPRPDNADWLRPSNSFQSLPVNEKNEPDLIAKTGLLVAQARSEERRVGKE